MVVAMPLEVRTDESVVIGVSYWILTVAYLVVVFQRQYCTENLFPACPNCEVQRSFSTRTSSKIGLSVNYNRASSWKLFKKRIICISMAVSNTFAWSMKIIIKVVRIKSGRGDMDTDWIQTGMYTLALDSLALQTHHWCWHPFQPLIHNQKFEPNTDSQK